MIILPIENIKQEREEWCWLAIVEQLITWRNGRSVEQDQLARAVGKRQGGTLADMQFLLKKETDLLTQKMTGNDILTLEASIKNREPVVLEVFVSDHEHHVLLLKGMAVDEQNGESVYLINDPLRPGGIGVAINPKVMDKKLNAFMLIMQPKMKQKKSS